MIARVDCGKRKALQGGEDAKSRPYFASCGKEAAEFYGRRTHDCLATIGGWRSGSALCVSLIRFYTLLRTAAALR
jgi:hypothetical protein